MNDKDNLYICGEHQIPVMYRGTNCPWCEFIQSMQEKVEIEYKRGWTEGWEAANAELNKPRS